MLHYQHLSLMKGDRAPIILLSARFSITLRNAETGGFGCEL
jgi:hypothetical protein